MPEQGQRAAVEHLVITETYQDAPLHSLRLSIAEGSFFYSRSGSVVTGAFRPDRRVTDWIERHCRAIDPLDGRSHGRDGARALAITFVRGEQKYAAQFRFAAGAELPPPVAALYAEYHQIGRLVGERVDPSGIQRIPVLEGEARKPWWKLW